jgi:hypothetical protein
VRRCVGDLPHARHPPSLRKRAAPRPAASATTAATTQPRTRAPVEGPRQLGPRLDRQGQDRQGIEQPFTAHSQSCAAGATANRRDRRFPQIRSSLRPRWPAKADLRTRRDRAVRGAIPAESAPAWAGLRRDAYLNRLRNQAHHDRGLPASGPTNFDTLACCSHSVRDSCFRGDATAAGAQRNLTSPSVEHRAGDCLSELVRVVKYLSWCLAPWTPCLIWVGGCRGWRPVT